MENKPKPQKKGRKPKNVEQEDTQLDDPNMNSELSDNVVLIDESQEDAINDESIFDEIPIADSTNIVTESNSDSNSHSKTNEEEQEQEEEDEPVKEPVKAEEPVELVKEEPVKAEEPVELVKEEPVKAEEPVKEEPVKADEVKPTLEIKSLLNLLIIISVREEMQRKYDLTPELIKVLTLVLQTAPNFFFKIEESFKKIVADNKIDSDDVPELMTLFSTMYELMASLKSQKDSIQLSNVCGDLIKLTFNILLTEGLIVFDALTQELTKTTFNTLVDSSVSLIKLSKTMKLSKKCCFM